MQPKPKLVSFLNQVFLDIKPKEETYICTNAIPLPQNPSISDSLPALEEAISLLKTFSESIPREKQKQILRQSLSQQGDRQLDQVLLEATLRKAQLTQSIQSSSQQIEEEMERINAEIERLWNLRDQVSEKSKQHQWALSQESARLDSVISLVVDSRPNKTTALPRNPRQLSALTGAR